MDISRYTHQHIVVYSTTDYDVNGNTLDSSSTNVLARVVLKKGTVRDSSGQLDQLDGHIKLDPQNKLLRDQIVEYDGVQYRVVSVYDIVGLRGEKLHNKYGIKRVSYEG